MATSLHLGDDDELTNDALPSPPRRPQQSRNEACDGNKKSASNSTRELPQSISLIYY